MQSSTLLILTSALSLRRGSITLSLRTWCAPMDILLRKDRAGTRYGGGVAVICKVTGKLSVYLLMILSNVSGAL